MTQPYFLHGHDGHQDQRFIGGALLPFLAGALIAAPFYMNRPGCFGGSCGFQPLPAPAPIPVPYASPFPSTYGMPFSATPNTNTFFINNNI